VYAPHGGLASLTNGASLVSTYFYNTRLQPWRISVKFSGSAPTNCADAATGNVLDFDLPPVSAQVIGSADDVNKRMSTRQDGRTGKPDVVDTYKKGNRDERRYKEQKAIDNNGGKENLDNKRNEVDPKKMPELEKKVTG
jgi:hypothetical protein